MKENAYKQQLVRTLRDSFREIDGNRYDTTVITNDPNMNQGISDLLVIRRGKVAWLETKRTATSSFRPNQEWFINYQLQFCFAAVVYPENEKEVLDALKRYMEVQQPLPPRR